MHKLDSNARDQQPVELVLLASYSNSCKSPSAHHQFEFFIICSISVKIIAHVYNDDRQRGQLKTTWNRSEPTNHHHRSTVASELNLVAIINLHRLVYYHAELETETDTQRHEMRCDEMRRSARVGQTARELPLGACADPPHFAVVAYIMCLILAFALYEIVQYIGEDSTRWQPSNQDYCPCTAACFLDSTAFGWQ
ncbi:hypothetical protein ACLKA6_010750 [Drosophila palustris]